MAHYRMDCFYYDADRIAPGAREHKRIVADSDTQAIRDANSMAGSLAGLAYSELRTMTKKPRLVHQSSKRDRDA